MQQQKDNMATRVKNDQLHKRNLLMKDSNTSYWFNKSPSEERVNTFTEVFDPDFKWVYAVPSKYVVHVPPARLNITRLVRCRNYRAHEPTSCTMGDSCKFIHADCNYDELELHTIHVNYIWRHEDLCTYPRLPAGDVLEVLQPNGQTPASLIFSSCVLVTRGAHRYLKQRSINGTSKPSSSMAEMEQGHSYSWGAGPTLLLSHCPQFYCNRICTRGEDCLFIHALYIDPNSKTLYKRAPARYLAQQTGASLHRSDVSTASGVAALWSPAYPYGKPPVAIGGEPQGNHIRESRFSGNRSPLMNDTESNPNVNDTEGNPNENDTEGNPNGNDTEGNPNVNDTEGNPNGNDTESNPNGPLGLLKRTDCCERGGVEVVDGVWPPCGGCDGVYTIARSDTLEQPEAVMGKEQHCQQNDPCGCFLVEGHPEDFDLSIQSIPTDRTTPAAARGCSVGSSPQRTMTAGGAAHEVESFITEIQSEGCITRSVVGEQSPADADASFNSSVALISLVLPNSKGGEHPVPPASVPKNTNWKSSSFLVDCPWLTHQAKEPGDTALLNDPPAYKELQASQAKLSPTSYVGSLSTSKRQSNPSNSVFGCTLPIHLHSMTRNNNESFPKASIAPKPSLRKEKQPPPPFGSHAFAASAADRFGIYVSPMEPSLGVDNTVERRAASATSLEGSAYASNNTSVYQQRSRLIPRADGCGLLNKEDSFASLRTSQNSYISANSSICSQSRHYRNDPYHTSCTIL
ncbi:unnamed protein product [Phytomonas sp. Hart1]|nr:unnamed protein product [Phytomonas sp. Hart1]|eukprot:CCW69594.1 unnamed protein product [Phytomonas sp. isolate Hart1]